MPLPQEDLHTIEEIYALPEGERAELIDGRLYMMVAPGREHQKIAGEIFGTVRDYIKQNKGSCEPYISPFAVFLNGDEKNYVEPDISVICDKNRLTDSGCKSAPDWVIKIVSPGSKHMDYYIKLFKYRTAGVREYWIVTPATKRVMVYDFQGDDAGDYSFTENIPVSIYPGFTMNLSSLL